jgi:hypothetical protein
MHKREMRHVEKILDDAKARGLYRDGAADDDAAIDLVGFGNRQEIGRGRPQRGPEIAVTLPRRQRRIISLYGGTDGAVGIAGNNQIDAQQPARRAADWDILQRLDAIPLIQGGSFGRSVDALRLAHALLPLPDRHPALA